MVARVLGFSLCSLTVLVVACGGESSDVARRTPPPPPHPSSEPSSTTNREAFAPTPPPEAETDTQEGFTEQGCSEALERLELMDCDPFGPDDVCGSGYGCKPYVVYPDGPCEPEIFGARCEPVGYGVQGDPCNDYPCASRFLCVTTGQGTQCAEICSPSAANSCPRGLICAGIDIEGIGTCF